MAKNGLFLCFCLVIPTGIYIFASPFKMDKIAYVRFFVQEERSATIAV